MSSSIHERIQRLYDLYHRKFKVTSVLYGIEKIIVLISFEDNGDSEEIEINRKK